MDYTVTEKSREYLESIIKPIIMDNPVECFDGYIRDKTFYGYIIGDVCLLKPKHVFPLIFSSTLKNRRNNSVELVMKVEDIPQYTIRKSGKINLVPCYYYGGGTISKNGVSEIIPQYKVWSYFRVVEDNFVYV